MNSRIPILLALPLVFVAARINAADPARPPAKAASPDALFDKYDANKDGVIDREEFKRLDADRHKAKVGKTRIDADADPVFDKDVHGDTGIRGHE